MSDQTNASEISADQTGQQKSRPRFVRHARNVIAFLLIGYGIWGLLFDDKALEAAVDPVDGNDVMWNAYVEDGGLNSDSRFHGLRIDKTTVTFTDDGGISDDSRGAVMVFRNGRKLKELGPLYQIASRRLILLRCWAKPLEKSENLMISRRDWRNA